MASGSRLLYRLASEKLRHALRFASGLFLLSAIVPDLGGAQRIALLFAAAILSFASFSGLGASRLGRLTLGVIGALYLFTGSWAIAALRAGEQLDRTRVSLGVVAAVLAAVAVHHAKRASFQHPSVRRLLVAASVCALAHYFWPWPSLGAGAELAGLAHLRSRALSWNLVSELVVISLALSPSIVVAFAWVHARRGQREASLLGLFVLYATLPLLLPLVSRSMTGQRGGFEALGALGAEVVANLAISIAVGSSLAFLTRWAHLEPSGPWTRRRGGLVLSGALVLTLTPFAMGGQRLLPWRLGPASAEGDRLFGHELLAWNDALATRDLRLAGHSGAEGDPDSAASKLVAGARQAAPPLVAPLEALVEAAARKQTTLPVFSARVAAVNAASRSASLPYYVDATEIVVLGNERWFRIDSYRIESAERFDVRGRAVELFKLRTLRPERSSGNALGLSRDGEPRVLILLDAIERYARELEIQIEREPGRCATHKSTNHALESALLRCGSLLREAGAKSRIVPALVAGVVRHELQHQLDGASPPVSDSLRRRVAAQGMVAVPPRINRELSAYLAELSAGDGSPHVSLARLLRLCVIDEREVNGAAARLALEALGRPEDATLDAPNAERAFEELAGLDDEALRERARRVWRREFGSELEAPYAADRGSLPRKSDE